MGIVIPNEIVPSVVRGKLVGIHGIGITPFRMEFEVRPIGVVGEPHLAFLLDGIVEYVEGDHYLLVVGVRKLRKIRNVCYFRMKVAIAE